MKPIRKRPSGWRTLRVGELELWWMVGQPRVIANLATEPGHAPTQTITLSLVVERADGSGKKLVATIRYSPSTGSVKPEIFESRLHGALGSPLSSLWIRSTPRFPAPSSGPNRFTTVSGAPHAAPVIAIVTTPPAWPLNS